MSYVGKPIRRVEDKRLITGRGTFVDDVFLPRMVYIAFYRSPLPHAKIKNIKVSSDFLIWEDLKDIGKPLPFNEMPEGIIYKSFPPLAQEFVRYVGEPIVAVLGESIYSAYDALDSVEVEFEPLPSVADVEKALDPKAPLVHKDLGTNLAYKSVIEEGDIEGSFKGAYKIVEGKFKIPRVASLYLEPRSILANYEPFEKKLTVWYSTQIPHRMRDKLSYLLNLPKNSIRVIAPDVGGAFGAKLNLYPDEYVTCLASIKLGRPVKFIESRREHMISSTHGRGMIAEAKMALSREGEIKGYRLKVIGDLGAYLLDTTPWIPIITIKMATGPYKIKNLLAEAYGVYTNLPPTGAYRGAGRPEATYILERMMDRSANLLNVDKAEIRKKNFISPNDFPYKMPSNTILDSGNYSLTLDEALKRVNYEEFKREQLELRKKGRYIGIGISCYVEACTFGWEKVRISINSDGSIIVYTGINPHGQGNATSLSQIVADELGVNLEDIRVIYGDTQEINYGMGTGGSRSLVVAGSALLKALEKVKERIIDLASKILEARREDLIFKEGRVYVKGLPSKSLNFKEIVSQTKGLEEEGEFSVDFQTAPFGTHLVISEVDIETGIVKVRKALLVDDVGKVINPLLVEGQIIGGAAQALAEALYEEMIFDDLGNPLNQTLMDYLFPTSLEIPNMECYRTYTPTKANPLGAKGVGEIGSIGFTPAVVNSIEDALSPFNIHIDKMPVSPDYLWSLIKRNLRFY